MPWNQTSLCLQKRDPISQLKAYPYPTDKEFKPVSLYKMMQTYNALKIEEKKMIENTSKIWTPCDESLGELNMEGLRILYTIEIFHFWEN